MASFQFFWRHIYLAAVTTVDDIDDAILEVDDGGLILKEERRKIEVKTVDDNTPKEDEDQRPTIDEVEQNKKWYKKT